MISRESKLGFHDYYKYRVSFITEKETNLIFLFVSSLTDKFENIKKELVKCKTEFLNLFADILQHRFDAKTFEVFDPIIDSIHRNLRPKISLVGFSGVGKTTITRLIKADEIPMQHIPTITGDIATIRIGKLHFHLWDFAGQEQFSYLWNNFIKGSDAILLITDSTLENVEKSKYFLELIKEQAPYAQSAVIGNKQDLKSAMNPVQIENLLGLKAYSMIALDPKNRDKMIQIIADILEMSAEVSPLLKPLLERDKLTEEAVKALKNADFNKAAFLFDKISDLCIELGDDSLGREFFEKSQKIKDMLKKVGAPPPTPAVPIIPEEQQAPVFHKKAEELEKSISLPKSTITPQSPPSIHQELKTEQKAVETPILNKSPQIPKSDINSLQPEISVKDTKEIVKPKETGVIKENVGLKLNPEDFMVKIKPKSVEFVPKDAKSKLKISPFSQVKNTDEFKAPVPVSPIRLMEQKVKTSIPESKKLKIPKTTVNSVDKITSEVISKVKQEPIIMDTQQKDDLKKSLLELKIKKANLTKMSLDFEMKELTGEITKDELKEKKEKVSEYVKKIEQQIQKLQKLLNN